MKLSEGFYKPLNPGYIHKAIFTNNKEQEDTSL